MTPFKITETLRKNIPILEIPSQGDGLQAILDPFENTNVGDVDGLLATIPRPDGSSFEWVIVGAEIRHNVPALYFSGLNQQGVPRLSQITWG